MIHFFVSRVMMYKLTDVELISTTIRKIGEVIKNVILMIILIHSTNSALILALRGIPSLEI